MKWKECDVLSGVEVWTDFRTGQYVNRYTYNGKQAQTELGWDWLNYGARYFDGLIGRWASVDPLADGYASFSPYNYCVNSPVVFVDPDGRDIIVGGQIWTPNATYKGDDDFGKAVFEALNSLNESIQNGVGDVETREAKGNVISDFVGEDSKDVEILPHTSAPFGQSSKASEDGTQIFWNPNEGLYVGSGEHGENTEGKVSPQTLLAHEFGHAWLAQFSPRLNEGFERADAKDIDSTNEHTWILKNVEAPFARARGEGIRNTYRGLVKDVSNPGHGDYKISY